MHAAASLGEKQYNAAATEEPMILAALYTDGIVADRAVADIAYGLRAEGFVVAGLVRRNEFVVGPGAVPWNWKRWHRGPC